MNEQGGRLARTWPVRWWRAGCFALLVALTGCAEVPQAPLAVGMNAWIGFDPLVLAHDQGLVDPGHVKVVELASGTEVQRALNNGLLDAAAITLDETLRLPAEEGGRQVPGVQGVLLEGASVGRLG